MLVFLKLGFNRLEKIPDLHKYTYLRHLELNNNMITKIEGISENKNLRVGAGHQILNLANNAIETIENLENIKLADLNLEGNRIATIHGLREQTSLQNLNFARNRIRK